MTEAHVEDAARKRPLLYDKGGDAHYDFTSAFIKSMRGSDPDAAVYYLAAMLEGGEDPRFIARRMIVLASEDIGNADPQALVVAVAAAQAVEYVGLPEARLNLSQAAIYLALAPKSNASYVAIKEATAGRPRAREHAAAEVAARRPLPGREEARPRRGLHLPARRSRRVRGRLPPRRAEGQEVLPAMNAATSTSGANGEPVVCLHGVTSYGGRFDWLAEAPGGTSSLPTCWATATRDGSRRGTSTRTWRRS